MSDDRYQPIRPNETNDEDEDEHEMVHFRNVSDSSSFLVSSSSPPQSRRSSNTGGVSSSTSSSSTPSRKTNGSSAPSPKQARRWRNSVTGASSKGGRFQRLPVEEEAENDHGRDREDFEDDEEGDYDEDDDDEGDTIDGMEDCADDQTEHTSNVNHSASLYTSNTQQERQPSFDFEDDDGIDDDDDDDDLGLARYNLDNFATSSSILGRTPGATLEESFEGGSIDLRLLWQAFVEAREESRRKRLERLLNINSEMERFSLCISSWCDLTDRGLILLLGITAIWAATCYFADSPLWLVWGVALLLMRIMWTPAYWFLRGRHVERRRKLTIELYDEMNARGGVGNEFEFATASTNGATLTRRTSNIDESNHGSNNTSRQNGHGLKNETSEANELV